MGRQHTLDIACGDAVVIVTRAATLRVDCHRMEEDWSLLLQYRAGSPGPAPCSEQPLGRASYKQSPQDRSPGKEQPPNCLNDIPGGTPDDEEPQSKEGPIHPVVECADEDRVEEIQGSIALGIIRKLGDLPPNAILSEDGLAKLFGRHRKSIKRAVKRGELPPSVRMFGVPVWTVEALREHTNRRLEAANKDAKRLQQRISRLRP